jgi:hypothetical protein
MMILTADTLSMPPSHSPRAKSRPGLRALEACGGGFWEFDLIDGSAWFNDWFYRKLDWVRDARRPVLGDLEPVLRPAAWARLMSTFRDHLERGNPLDLEIEVEVAGQRLERWRMRGSAQRNGAGQPVYLAGSMWEVSDQPEREEVGTIGSLRGAFDALPVAAALLDSHAAVLVSNQLWSAFPGATAAQALARLRAANSQTAIEFWLDQDSECGSARQLRVRAIAFQHEGSRHLVVTLEDRRSD